MLGRLGLLMGVGVMALVWTADADATTIHRVTEAVFTPDAGLITFSEFSLGTVNPTYTPADYGGGAGAPTVTFDGFFDGQSLGTVATCPAGAALTGCVVGSPTGPLALDPASPETHIQTDGANPTSPVLSGEPTFNGPVSVLFDTDIAGVGLDGGYFDAIGGTAITAFARDGSVLGTVTNEGFGIEFLGLVTDDLSDSIAGLQFSLVGAEPAGFGIDNLRFGRADAIDEGGPAEVPEPATLLLMGSGLASLALGARRRRRGEEDPEA